MKKLLFLTGLLIPLTLVPAAPADIHKQLEEAADRGDLKTMQILLRRGAHCTPAALSSFFIHMAYLSAPITDQAVTTAELLFPHIMVGIDGTSAINQGSCLRTGKRYVPLTWMIENYECAGNAEKIAELLIKYGADSSKKYQTNVTFTRGMKTPLVETQTPLECAQKSKFKSWVAYLKQKQS